METKVDVLVIILGFTTFNTRWLHPLEDKSVKSQRAEELKIAGREQSRTNGRSTFSISSIHCCRSMPKSMKVHSIPSRWYSSCSRTNMWWLKNCCSFSLVKLMQSCSNPLYCGFVRTDRNTVVSDTQTWTSRWRRCPEKTIFVLLFSGLHQWNDFYLDGKQCLCHPSYVFGWLGHPMLGSFQISLHNQKHNGRY